MSWHVRTVSRVATTVGGVSTGRAHGDGGGPRAGWVDEPLDRWLLERLERNDGEALKHLFRLGRQQTCSPYPGTCLVSVTAYSNTLQPSS
jgi:hypothetical protein